MIWENGTSDRSIALHRCHARARVCVHLCMDAYTYIGLYVYLHTEAIWSILLLEMTSRLYCLYIPIVVIIRNVTKEFVGGNIVEI
jgi:hypothetical protein